MLKNILKKFLDKKVLLSKFALVGVSGIFVNEGTLALFTEVFAITVGTAGIVAIEISIITNFLLNNFWTWEHGGIAGFWKRMLKYHLIAAVAGVINWLFLVGLSEAGLHHLIANLIGIGAGFVINFLFNHLWTFNKKEESPEQ